MPQPESSPFSPYRSSAERPLPPVPDRPADDPIYTPPGGPPGTGNLSKDIYAAMGEANINAMLADFYDRLGSSEAAHLFAKSPEVRRRQSEKSAAFFVFLLGGPPLYQQRYGPPMMRARHLSFRIDEAARQAWLDTFYAVLADAPSKYDFPREHMAGFVDFLDRFSAWMVNAE